MSRIFTDANLMTWEAYASGGKFGLAREPHVVFHCASVQNLRARYVRLPGDEADAEAAVQRMSDAELREMLARAEELD